MTCRQSRGWATLQLAPAPPRPSNGSCRATVEGGAWPAVALVDRVVVSCRRWLDHSHSATPLLDYHVFVNDSMATHDGAGRQVHEPSNYRLHPSVRLLPLYL